MNQVQRKCIVTGKIVSTNELIKFVLLKDGQIKLETSEKIYGRGAYCLKQKATIEELFKKRLLNKSFKTNIASNVYEQLYKEVIEHVKE